MITFRTGLDRALTHAEMDENFSSVYFSSSIHNTLTTAKELKLWFDSNTTSPTLYHSVILPAPGGVGTVTITNDGNNRLVTANGDGTIRGEENFLFNGSILSLTGRFEPIDSTGNISIGTNAGINATSGDNVLVGSSAGQNLQGSDNLAVGNASLINAIDNSNTAIGNLSLTNLYTGVANTAIGYLTAENVDNGTGNVYIGNEAGPAAFNITQNNKLYINNSVSNTPLIYGDFATGQVTIKSQVSASVFSGSFVGNGAGLTGVSTEWDGSRNGNAEITGSLIVSGAAGTKVDFTKVAAISGSIFSGSFVGDGSGLTGIVSTSEWDGSRNGNAEITGSFIVSGSLSTISLKGKTFIDTNIKIHNPVVTSIGIGQSTFNNSTAIDSIAIGQNAGALATKGPSISIGVNTGTRANYQTVYVGHQAGMNNTGTDTVALGALALFTATSAAFTVAIGTKALHNIKAATYNTVVGAQAVWQLENGNTNTIIGSNVLGNLVDGSSNTAVGFAAGSRQLKQGSGNVYLGANSGNANIGIENNQLYIDNTQRNDALIRGDFSTKTLTLNTLKLIIPFLINAGDPSNAATIAALPLGTLYRDNDLVMVKI
jgi:hypothetical protein